MEKGLGMKKIKKIRVGGLKKIKNLLGGHPPCVTPGKGEGVYAARRPFVNVTNVTQRNEYIIYYIKNRSFLY